MRIRPVSGFFTSYVGSIPPVKCCHTPSSNEALPQHHLVGSNQVFSTRHVVASAQYGCRLWSICSVLSDSERGPLGAIWRTPRSRQTGTFGSVFEIPPLPSTTTSSVANSCKRMSTKDYRVHLRADLSDIAQSRSPDDRKTGTSSSDMMLKGPYCRVYETL